MSSHPYTNHLIGEKSPYLLQHAHNPVDWYPWGEEAFALAKQQDKPIFLSIGYATCHWCHVMEHESFQDPALAQLMNETFVNVKVDREELPEVDSVYMEFAQVLMSSAGGWPLNVLLTPELKPFFAVTYLPPKTRRGFIGLDQFITHIKQLWQSDQRSEVVEQANKIVEVVERATKVSGDEIPGEDLVLNSLERFFELADPVYGGIKGEPKFPLGYQSNFLLQYAKANNESRALFYVELTQDMMARGGIYDHLGGGFSRYSVDEHWQIPHFEKMLYDNAILAKAYLESWQYTKKQDYRRISKETLEYVLRDMMHPEGGFYSAEDADSQGFEGRFYTWTDSEVREILSLQDAELFCQYYGVKAEGNFEGRSVLHCETPLENFAEMSGIPLEELEQRLSASRKALFEKRLQRPRPFKDDKILSGWNGLMIDALVRAGRSFKDGRFIQAALKAAEFLKSHLWKDEKLLRRWRDGEARFESGLDEYAYLISGLLSLFEGGCGNEWLEWALKMTDFLEKEFKAPGGAFYHTDAKQQVLLRKCEYYDGSEPSGNGVHAENLLRLFQMTQEEKYLSQAEDIFKAARPFIEAYPPGACYHLLALQRYLDPKAPTLVVALDEKESFAEEIFTALSSHFCPHAAVVWKRHNDQFLAAHLDKLPIDGQTTVYVCRQESCGPPLLKQEDILKAIGNL